VKPITIGVAALLVAAAAVIFIATREVPVSDGRAPTANAPAPAAPPSASAPPSEPIAAAPEPAAVTTSPVRKPPSARKVEPSRPAEPAVATLATLILDTDVPGASVFINREFVGTTPLRLAKLEPGTKQLKLTADGHDGIERSVDLAAGDNPLTLRFREVRLNKRIPVAHKHGMGGCDGTLVATIDGLAYETSNNGDAFNLPYAQLESFLVDYLEKNLKVKQKGGKTWNFTDKNASNADALFVFHRDVEAARKKLADGYAAVR
jgi:PEGA domain